MKKKLYKKKKIVGSSAIFGGEWAVSKRIDTLVVEDQQPDATTERTYQTSIAAVAERQRDQVLCFVDPAAGINAWHQSRSRAAR